MTNPTYTPYDGSARPFTIGLSPLDPNRWIEPDADLSRYLDEKSQLEPDHFADIFRAASDTAEAQQEVLGMLVEHLTRQHPDLYLRKGDIIQVAGRTIDLKNPSRPPLLIAGSLIQDDLVLMRRRERGWSIAAAHLAFPSSWSLAEKFDRPMDEVHADVPGFAGGTRNAALINRIFDNLLVEQPVKRLNWSINWTYALYHPRPSKMPVDPASTGIAAANSFIRVERQTLRRLPISGDILFTIRIYLDPMATLTRHEEHRPLALAMAEQLEALSPDQVAYKGLAEKRDALVAYLRAK
ncbi:DUF3445 domain-containing protein [Rhizobium sp. RU36D]|uniref:heme-dependent oxidative N-demethylase family protein n=1 Tax=Rhizobium sp. RU36D TaxID=1907415 RepID=UPI0009D8EF48|nr:DUF3445 domain-containing protein [Rhizobium sp. RU36D]SMC42428.1 Protein of unknown function [Rhizobium sp. RU36D]